MRKHPLSQIVHRVPGWTENRRLRLWAFWGMLATGALLGLATFASLAGLDGLAGRGTLRLILIADFIYALTVAAFVARGIAGMIAARRRKSAGSQLHLRLARIFTLVALVPTILVAVFATITLNFGLEGWFSDRVHDVVSNSLEAAQAYEEEHRATLVTDAEQLARYIDRQKERYPLLSGGELREYLTLGQQQMQRSLPKAYVISGQAALRARGERSYLFHFEPPTPEDIALAREGETVVIQDWEDNEFRALLQLDAFADRFLYVSRYVDGEILGLLDETQETVRLYQQLEADRGRLLFEFALIYLGFALAVILAAMWLGLWFAERLARPVGRLASAAERVGQGDLNVRVRAGKGGDEIALLGRTFNEMTRQVKGQRDELVAAHEGTERRRRLFDSVLSGVSAGVIGLDATGNIGVINSAAADMLDVDRDEAMENPLSLIAPEFVPLLARLGPRGTGPVTSETSLRRLSQERDLLVRAAARYSMEGDLEGYVVSFDDVTDLVAAQRMAAWGDVARRIAHEVKNPLTPIQLSAERMRRKFGPLVGEQRESLEQLADVIVRQTNDLRRIVDEFSKFARMPKPQRRPLDLNRLISDSVLLQESGQPDISYRTDLPETAVLAQLDATMIGQALTNLMKNAAEAIGDRKSAEPDLEGEIRVIMTRETDFVCIEILDNGSGLPQQPARLFEPYVSNRAKGTGLGLPIVKKIIEEHDGSLDLRPAPAFGNDTVRGACARIILPQGAAGSGPTEEATKDSEIGRIAEKLRERTK